jgi:hypothetical protein
LKGYLSEISGATTVPVLFGAGGQAINRNGRWVTPDSRGSTSRVTDGTGNVVQTYGYGVFGQVVPSTPEANPIQFLGGMNDNNGLQYLGGSNYFSPQVGQPINGKLAQVAGGLLGKVVDFVKGVGDCAVGAVEGVVTSLAAVNPITGPFVQREMATEAAKAGIGLGQQLQREGWATTVVDGAANLTGQFGDYSTPRKAGRSLCNAVGLGLAIEGSARVVQNPGEIALPTSGGLKALWRVVDPVEGNDLLNSGVWKASPTGAEGKYFWGSLGSAQKYAASLNGRLGYTPASIFSSQIDSTLVEGPYTMDYMHDAFFVPNKNLGGLSPPVLVEIM